MFGTNVMDGTRGVNGMQNYWGVVIDQSLKDQGYIDHLNVVAKRQVGGWGMLLTSVPADAAPVQIASLQSHMVDISNDCWYAHFFRDDELIIVYQDCTFRMTIDRLTWNDSIQYGLHHGIPLEQLDFWPCTTVDASTYFGVSVGRR
jgi:hypothetical protein